MANRCDRNSKMPRQLKRQLALAEAHGHITDSHQRGEVKRIMQSAHATHEVWHKKMLIAKDNIDVGNDTLSDARPEDTSTTVSS